MGTKPSTATRAVVRTARRRLTAPSTRRLDRRRRRRPARCRMACIRTRPFRVATPETAMKPTAAEIENGMPRSSQGQGAADEGQRHAGEDQRRVLRTSPAPEQQHADGQEDERHDQGQARAGALQVLELAAPVEPAAGGRLDLARRPWPGPRRRSRRGRGRGHWPGRSMRRLPFSRLIWLGPRRRRSGRRRTAGTVGAPASASSGMTGSWSMTAGSLRRSSPRRTTTSKRRSPSRTWPAERPPRAMARASAASRGVDPLRRRRPCGRRWR